MASNRTARSWKRRIDQLADGPQLEDLAVVHDRQAVAQDLGFLHVVRRQEDRPALRSEPPDDVPQRAPGGRVHAGRRLVEEHELGVADERQGDRESLALAARQVLRPRAPLLAEVHQPDQLAGRAAFG